VRAILIDDDERNLNALSEKLLKHCPQVKIVTKCDTAEKGIKAIDENKPDIVFLDIEMPVMNGFLMLQQLEFKNFELIFVTAYNHYAIQAIKYSALDYLVKPVEIEELKEAVSRALKKRTETSANPQIELLLEHFQKKERQRIAIPTSEGMQFININDIVYLEASINYTYIYLANQKFLVSKSLKEFEDILPADVFLRIHHSFIVNKNCVEKYLRGDGGQVILNNGATLDVSKRKKADFLQAIGY
jgi:two-component system, LytTR family, response regulator